MCLISVHRSSRGSYFSQNLSARDLEHPPMANIEFPHAATVCPYLGQSMDSIQVHSFVCSNR
eukprot:m.21174 g.21174  ORF g.21174 m.21174 type:complete len:62 (-) comp12327_c0_seq2:1899-2084(-)